MQKLIVFFDFHLVQGVKNFGKHVVDPDYKGILGAMIQDHHG